MTDQARLDILLNAQNRASQEVRTLKAELKDLDGAAQSVAGGLGGLGKALGAAGVVALGAQAAQAAGALSDQAASMRRAEVAALSLAGSQEKLNSLLDTYVEATGGAVTRGEALAEVSRLQSIGFADNAQELERFLTAARGASLATGKAVGDIIGEMQLAIANQSTMRLDQIGLGVSEVKGRIEELRAANAGMSAEQAYQEAVVGRLIEKYGDVATSAPAAATGVEKLRTAWRGLQEQVAEDSGGGIDRAANWLAGIVDQVTGEFDANAGREGQNLMASMLPALREVIAAQREEMAAVDDQIARYRQLEDSTGAVAKVIRELEAEKARLGGQISANRDLLMSYTGALNEATGASERSAYETGEAEQAAYRAAQAFDEAGNSAAEAGPKIANMGIDALAAAEQFDIAMQRVRNGARQLQGVASGLVDNLGAAGTQDWLAEQTATLAMYQQYWGDVAGYSDEYIDNVLTPAFVSNLREGANELDRQEKAAAKLATTVPQISKEFQALQSTVGSVLSQALDTGTGVDPEDILAKMGLRPDAINENARRLADIAANGLKDQDWLGDFQAEAPNIWQMIRTASNPQEEAAYLLREFQQGLQPELIDKGRAKELVRAMITGDRNMKELAEEIAGELAAEMGIPLQEALGAANAALGANGPGALGESTADQFGQGAVDAVAASDKGGELVGTFLGQIKATYADITQAAVEAGSLWADGFMSGAGNISTRTVDLLVNLVTPGVMAQIATNRTLTEPVN
jgi:hypothetical protein